MSRRSNNLGTPVSNLTKMQDDTQIAPTSPGLGQSGLSTYYGSPFEACSAGLGGMMRELGYTIGCIPEEVGGESRNLHSTTPTSPIPNLSNGVAFHRTFVTREGFNSRTQLQGVRPCLPPHESSWHRLDCIQFRYHPSFALPMEHSIPPDEIIYWPCENGLIVSSPSSIILVLIRVVGKSWPVAWFEYVTVPDKEVFLFQSDLVDRMPIDEREKEMLLEVLSAGGGRVRFNWKSVMKAGRTHVPEQGGEVFRSRMVGGGNTEGSTDSGDVVFKSQLITVALINIRISPS
jgi:Putative peptidase family